MSPGLVSPAAAPLLAEAEQKLLSLLHEVAQFTSNGGDAQAIAGQVRAELALILRLPVIEQRFAGATFTAATAGLTDQRAGFGSLLAWAFTHALGQITAAPDHAEQTRSWIDEWRLGRIIGAALRDLGVDEPTSQQGASLVKYLTSYQGWFAGELRRPRALAQALLSDREIQQALRVNRYQDVLWFDKQAFERLLWWLLRVAIVGIGADPAHDEEAASAAISECYRTVQILHDAASRAGYQVEQLRALAL